MSIIKEKVHKTVYIIFISLLLDLLAFTMILPLFPSLLDHYKVNDNIGLYKWLSSQIYGFQVLVGAPEKYNSVLLGGFLGSLFSFLQFLSAPIFGGMSDIIGRKKVMFICLVGISLSYVLWALSSNLMMFILARFLGGISKGNVSLSMAIITDVSSIETRGKGMEKRIKDVKVTLTNSGALINVKDLFRFTAVTGINSSKRKELTTLGLIYFVYLLIYSGLEFTLTFLTHHVFNYTAMQQGWMFFVIGITMAVIQGIYVRKIHPQKTKSIAVKGLWLTVPAFICVGIAFEYFVLYFGLLLFSISTAMVVPSIMTMASEHGSEQQKGIVMGIFRSLGALARAVGPIFASIAFWSVGSKITYLTGSVLLLWPAITLGRMKYVISSYQR
ncbi:major facilitator superfamily domain-containing protein 10 isoform X2 [Diorhabda carinulata]|uniref:major facilitator superfamily domain-containing protein 10 isoform X2 n=1 Tax=Diorhabda carinulata TaxID=1163345 RepID=UPI0025A176D8|nr:major facilitator superfamily domain-containing protein 10 isoform X2 [Diorhabda carinulata]